MAAVAAIGYALVLAYQGGNRVEAIGGATIVAFTLINYQHNTEIENLSGIWDNGMEAVLIAHLRAILQALYTLAIILAAGLGAIAALLAK